MSTLHTFLASATPKAAEDLEAALLNLPADKRGWSAGGQTRTALDMVAECAILTGSSADAIKTHVIENFDLAAYQRQKDELGQDLTALFSLLHENTARAVAAVHELSDDDLQAEITAPWGPMTMTDLISYPYWNMMYHQGQINFIAQMQDSPKE